MAAATSKLKIIISAKDMASRTFGGIGSAAKGLGSAITKFMAGGAIAGATAMAGLGVASVTAAAGFESSMSKVKAVTGATGKDFASLISLAEQLGRDTAFSASQAASGMEFLGRAGFSTSEILRAMPATLDLAAAGALELGQAADISSNILTGFRLEASDMNRVADVLAETAASTNVTVGMLGDAFSYVAPVAASVGMSIEEASAAIGLMGNAGIQASMAGTSLRQAFAQLLGPTDEQTEKMGKLGLRFTNSKGELVPFLDMIRQLELQSVSTADMMEIFGVRAGPAMEALVAQGSGALGDLTEQLETSQGRAKSMAGTMLDNLTGSFTILKSSVEGLLIKLGGGEGGLTSTLKTLVDTYVIPAVNAMTDFAESVGGLSGALELAKDLFVIFVKWLVDNFVRLFTDISYYTTYITNFGIILLAAIKLVGNFSLNLIRIIVRLSSVLWSPLLEVFLWTFENIKYAFQKSVHWIVETGLGAVNLIIRGLNAVKVFGTIEEMTFKGADIEAPKAFAERWEESGERVRELYSGIGDDFKTMGSDLVKDAKEIASAATETLKDLGGDDLTAQFDDAIKAHQEKAAEKKIEFPPIDIPAIEIADMGTDVGSVSGGLVASIGDDMWDTMAESFDQGFRLFEMRVGRSMEDLRDNVEAELAGAFRAAMDFEFDWTNVEGSFKEMWENVETTAGEILGQTISDIKDCIAAGFAEKAMKRLIGPGIDAILGGLGSIITKTGLTGGAFSSMGLASIGGLGLVAIALAGLIRLVSDFTGASRGVIRTGGDFGEGYWSGGTWVEAEEEPLSATGTDETIEEREARIRQKGGPEYQHGGFIPFQMDAVLHGGEGVLSRRGMGALGGVGKLDRLNRGESGGGGGMNVTIQIQAWDGEDVERVVRSKVVPLLKRLSLDGMDVIYDSGVRAVA